MTVDSQTTPLSPKDYASDQHVRWCPGCGDYSILAQMKKALAELQIPKEKCVFISGIGCSSRFPYYLDTYGIHGIHGRAAAIATGLKMARPDLSVWVITGDGDGLSIGGNHFIHTIRRNVDLNIVLFNNRIYGLTKGQVSPTSEFGKKTKSTPWGSVDNPVRPISAALGAEATFVARTIDTHVKHLANILVQAAQHKGVSFVEVYQNCNIFNDGAYLYATDRQQKFDNVLELEHGKPMIFGKNGEKGIRFKDFHLEVVTIGENGVTENDLLVHDETRKDPSLAFLLGNLSYPEFPEPIGVFRSVSKPSYEELVANQIQQAREKIGKNELKDLLYTGDTWVVE
ncbi:MAG: 2-oxoacid:ferredoxin oxidoreductase subunit beta [Candidatus Omnitrophica bacterium]|nr:2-oxoacid:ferredoxin oxidoreductase subunit beta [Candidatus Omnitrophota bacterium]